MIDVTAQKNLEAELRDSREKERRALEAALAAAKIKDEFLANMSHEIRTPCNGVVGMTGLLLDTHLTRDQRSYVETIQLSAESLVTIVNDILDFTKLESGKVETESIDFSLAQIADDTVKLFALNAERARLQFFAEVDSALPLLVTGDPTRTRQVLNNLVANALKFTADGAVSVHVRAGAREGEVRFEVRDSGIGIPSGAYERIFKAFSQADASTTRRFGGTGLGLSISKALVERLGGTIGVESREGEGSTFWFILPLPAATRTPVLESIPETLPRFDRPLRILIAEDNMVNQRILVLMLSKMGHRAEAVANGNEALDAIRSVPYDLVLMDCQMPEMDGYEATRLIKTAESFARYRTIPIIAFTAHAMTDDAQKCLDAGMDDYMTKPTTFERLASMISKWTRRAGELTA